MNTTLNTGLIVGAISSIFLAILATNGDFGGSPIKYVRYIIIMLCLIIFYRNNIKKWSYKAFMPKFIGSAFRIALISGVMVALTNTILFLINPSFSIQKYNLLPESFGQLLMIDFVLIIEMIVLGLLTSFIIFPLYKNYPKEKRIKDA